MIHRVSMFSGSVCVWELSLTVRLNRTRTMRVQFRRIASHHRARKKKFNNSITIDENAPVLGAEIPV